MTPTFFGSSKSPLFGVYHAPMGSRPRETGILLCYPAPQEYMRTHWAFRKLALLLTRQGFHVFRFDYYGTGDSAGPGDAGRLATWRENIRTAAQELRDLGSVSRISAVGFRLGAALAATTPGLSLADLVLWEPVVNGRVYLSELEIIQARQLSQDPCPAFEIGQRPEELLGFALPAELEQEVLQLNLVREAAPAAKRTAIMVSEDGAIVRELERALRRQGADVVFRHVPDEPAAGRSDSLQAALLSNAMLDAIAAHFT